MKWQPGWGAAAAAVAAAEAAAAATAAAAAAAGCEGIGRLLRRPTGDGPKTTRRIGAGLQTGLELYWVKGEGGALPSKSGRNSTPHSMLRATETAVTRRRAGYIYGIGIYGVGSLACDLGAYLGKWRERKDKKEGSTWTVE